METVIIGVSSVSILFQGTAAFLALRLIKITGNYLAWILISCALVLMAVRRVVVLVETIRGDFSPAVVSNEIIGLVISIAMLLGVILIKRFFAEYKTAKEELTVNEKRYHELAASITDIFFALAPDMTVTYWNRATEAISGYTSEFMVGKNILSVLRPGFPIELESFLQSAVATRIHRHDMISITVDGSVKYFFFSAYPKDDGVAIFGRDDTERVLMSKQNQEYAHELEQANSNKDKFFSIVAHDLKSPFQSLLGFSELLSVDFEEIPPEKAQQFAKNIHSQAKQIYSLIDNLLHWSRLQLSRMSFNPSSLLAKSEARRAISLFESTAAQKNIFLIEDIKEETEVFADSDLLQIMMRNLISNALKYTSANGTVLVFAESSDAGTTLSVRDTGTGMPPERLHSLFSFGALKSSKGTSGELGTGLGLILTKELIEKHGGHISVESSVGKFTVFSLFFPNALQ